MFTPEDHEELVTFLYQIPFGVARMDPEGNLGMSNPMVMQLMLQINPGSINLFETLRTAAPHIELAVRNYPGSAGVVLSDVRVHFGPRGPKKTPLVLTFTVSKLADERFMVVIAKVPTDLPPEGVAPYPGG